MTKNPSESPSIFGGAYKELIKIVTRYAENDKPVLFVGETGTGKELFARLYFEKNKRKTNRTVNCAAFTDELLNSEIFGHKKGAFTGANSDRSGLLNKCKKGILFLDELGVASPSLQASIRRVAEGNSYRPLGSDDEITDFDTRIIAATTNLASIDEDIKYRFIILPIPPLQNFDIPQILRRITGKPLKRKILERLMEREYPGNVRQLLKEFDRIEVEEGGDIFSLRPSDTINAIGSFDYDRFRKEYFTWQKYIQPIIDRFNFWGIRYRYLKDCPEKNWDNEGMMREYDGEVFYNQDYSKIPEIPEYINSIDQMISDIEKLNSHLDPNLLRAFEFSLKAYIKRCQIPILLKKLSEHYGGFDKASMQTSIENIDSLSLFEIKPHKEGIKNFERLYMDYHLQKNDFNKKKTSKDIGMPYATFMRKIRSSL
jgi:DNA-binding NtrC family response regulator